MITEQVWDVATGGEGEISLRLDCTKAMAVRHLAFSSTAQYLAVVIDNCDRTLILKTDTGEIFQKIQVCIRVEMAEESSFWAHSKGFFHQKTIEHRCILKKKQTLDVGDISHRSNVLKSYLLVSK